jgi:dTMP kinase
MNAGGKFIVVDGPDGAGKGTQLDRLEAWIRDDTPCVRAKDPGGTIIGDRIRHLLLDYDLSDMDARCEALLFMASRAQLVAEVVRPALAAGKCVLGDRFISATCAYQVAAGFPAADVIALGRLAIGDTWPDLTIVLDVPAEVGLKRAGRSATGPRRSRNNHGQVSMFGDANEDAMERRPITFHRRVRELFQALPSIYPAPVRVIDANRDADAVFREVQEAVRASLG